MIYIVGLGANDINSLTLKAYEVLNSNMPLYLRTNKHPIIKDINREYKSFDYLYEESERFEDVYNEIVKILIEEAKDKDIIYAVPGSPLFGEKTVELLVENEEVELISSVSFFDSIINTLKIDPLNGIQIVDGLSDFKLNNSNATIVTQLYSRKIASDIKLKLLNYYNDLTKAVIVKWSDKQKKEMLIDIKLYELDRHDYIDHLTSLYIPAQSDRKLDILDLSEFLEKEDFNIKEANYNKTNILKNLLKMAYLMRINKFDMDASIKKIIKKIKKLKKT